jgi:hypothetical protein
MKQIILSLAFAAAAFAQASFGVTIGSEPTVTISMNADAVVSITAAIQNIIAGPPPTTLGVAATSGAATVTLTSAAGVASGMGLKIDSEILGVASVAGNVVTVVRGQIGSTAAAHLISAPVVILRNGLYGEYVANLVGDAIRAAMLSYPPASIVTIDTTIATQQTAKAALVAGAVTHVP